MGRIVVSGCKVITVRSDLKGSGVNPARNSDTGLPTAAPASASESSNNSITP